MTVLLAVGVLWASGCGGPATGQTFALVPYVEEIQFPAELQIGTEGQIRLTLSTALAPNTLAEWSFASGIVASGQGATKLRYDYFLRQRPPAGSSAPGNLLVIPVRWEEPGDYTYSFGSAPASESGGTQAAIPSQFGMPQLYADAQPYIKKEITIAVIP